MQTRSGPMAAFLSFVPTLCRRFGRKLPQKCVIQDVERPIKFSSADAHWVEAHMGLQFLFPFWPLIVGTSLAYCH